MPREPNTTCSVCNRPLYRRPAEKERCPESFCSTCFDPAQHSARGNRTKYLGYIRRWKQGLESGMSGQAGISGHIRRYLFEKKDHKCEKCGWSEVNIFTENIPLQINHIDGDYKNNKEENLELVCPNCHSLTEFHGSRNKGRGRPR